MTKLGMKRTQPKKRIRRLKRDPLDVVFSDYIRLKADYTCEYCGKKGKGAGMHCSHFIGRRYRATRWLGDNCSCLCMGCHNHMDDFHADHVAFMIKKLGSDRVEQLTIIAIQKAEGADAGRGGQFTKDFADLELLIDRFGESDVLLTIGKVKEYTHPVVGKTYAYSIQNGVKIINFREVKRCPYCKGQGYTKGVKCDFCFGKKFVDVEEEF